MDGRRAVTRYDDAQQARLVDAEDIRRMLLDLLDCCVL
jgi:hypothetical protein